MVKITNTSAMPLDFPVKGHTAQNPKTESIPVGETKDIEVDEKSALVVGRAHAGAIKIGGRVTKAAVENAAETPPTKKK